MEASSGVAPFQHHQELAGLDGTAGSGPWPGLRDHGLVRQAFDAAGSQYSLRRSDYLQGVMAALCWVLGDSRRPPVSRVPQATEEHPPGAERVGDEEGLARAAVQATLSATAPSPERHDFCMGAAVALAWAAGFTEAPPVRSGSSPP
jgi:hypothetical protein